MQRASVDSQDWASPSMAEETTGRNCGMQWAEKGVWGRVDCFVTEGGRMKVPCDGGQFWGSFPLSFLAWNDLQQLHLVCPRPAGCASGVMAAKREVEGRACSWQQVRQKDWEEPYNWRVAVGCAWNWKSGACIGVGFSSFVGGEGVAVFRTCTLLIPCPQGLSEVVSPLGHFWLHVTELWTKNISKQLECLISLTNFRKSAF